MDAVYDRTEEVKGVETYVYRVEIVDAPIEIAEGVPGTYTDTKEIFVEPVTGAILNQTDDQQRYLEDGTQVLDLQLGVHRRAAADVRRRDRVQGAADHPGRRRSSRWSAGSADRCA